MQKSFRSLLYCFSLCFILGAGLACAANPAGAPLPNDPLITEGVLPNGMHYIIRPNKTPGGQVSMWLHIGTGSINETDQERGLAHYLEHMAFDGTEHFPPGAMTAKLRAMGLTVGVHQNAFTSYDQTTFQLNLPNTAPESIKTALLCLSDIAYRMTVPPDQIEKEKKIVLEELRARSGPHQRTMKQELNTLFADTKLGQRDVIGTEESIKSFTRQQVLDFYHRGYQPEKATLMIVGDIQPADLVKLIPGYFADWQSTSPKNETPPETVQSFTKHEQVITDPELATATVSLYAKGPAQPLNTEADFRSLLIAKLTDWIIATRMETLVEKGGAPFQHSDVEPGNFLNFCNLNSATLAGDPQKWRDMLKTFATECHRVDLYGFSNQEIADAKAAIMAEAKRTAQTLETRDSIQIVGELNEALSEKSNPVSDSYLRDLAQRQVPAITAADLETYFKATFDRQKWLTVVTLPAKTTPQPAAGEIQSIIASAYASPVQPLAAYREVSPILDKDPVPPPAGPAKVEYDADLDVTSATLVNSVVVNHHAMSSTKNEIHIKLTLPGGEIAETAANRGITQMVASCLNQTATNRLSSMEMKRILNGKNIQFYVDVEPDALTLNITTTAEDLKDSFRLLRAILTSARLENSAAENWRGMMMLQLEAEKSNVAAAEMWALRKELYSGDLRRSQVPVANINNLKLEEAQRWADHLLQKSPVEIGIV
jgi:zinc protease